MQQQEPHSPYHDQDWREPYLPHYADEQPYSSSPYFQEQQPLSTRGHHQVAARGFAQTFGLLPAMAILTLVTDTMIFGGDVASAGLLLPVSIGAGVALGVIVFLAQRKYYGDDDGPHC